MKKRALFLLEMPTKELTAASGSGEGKQKKMARISDTGDIGGWFPNLTF